MIEAWVSPNHVLRVVLPGQDKQALQTVPSFSGEDGDILEEFGHEDLLDKSIVGTRRCGRVISRSERTEERKQPTL